MSSAITTKDFYRLLFPILVTFAVLLTTNGKVLVQSPETIEKQTSLEGRILDLEKLVGKLTMDLQHHDQNNNGKRGQVRSDSSRARRSINVTDHNTSGIPNPIFPNELGPVSYDPMSVASCQTGLPGRDGRDGRDGPAGLFGRDGNIGLKGDPGGHGDKGNTGERGEPGRDAPDTHTSNGGTTYIRWGRVSCPQSTELVYHGITGGAHYRDSGSGANLLCLPNDPEYLDVQAGTQRERARIYSTEYELFAMQTSLHNHEVPCALCTTHERSIMIMIPAKITCPANWTSEYRGYLMAERADYKRGEFICVDENAESRPGSSPVNEDGALLHRVEGRCSPGNLPCLPYIGGHELACVVCTI